MTYFNKWWKLQVIPRCQEEETEINMLMGRMNKEVARGNLGESADGEARRGVLGAQAMNTLGGTQGYMSWIED